MNQNKSSMPRPAGMPGRHRAMLANSGEKAKNFKATITCLIKYLQPFWGLMVVVFAFAIAGTIFSIISPKMLGSITNEVVKGLFSPQGINFTKIGETATLLIGFYLLNSFFHYIQGWIMTGISQKISYQFRKDISKKINRLPLKYFDGKTHGDVLSRVTNDVDTVSQTLNQSLTQIVTSITLLVGILVMMLSISEAMTLVALLVMPLSFGFVKTIVKNSQRLFKSQQDALGKINGHVEEMFSGHSVMKVFNGEQQSIAIFNKINTELYQNAWKAQFLSGLLMPIMNFIGNLGYVGVAILGGWLAVQGKINIGDIQAFIQYLRQFNHPITQTANIANILQSTAAAAERVFEFLMEEEEKAEKVNALKISPVIGHVQFGNVVFGYSPKNKVIKNFSADIKPGQRVAIVGPTGAGKTTIVNLLMRFYDVNKGAIKIDGVDIRQLKRSDLRKMFGMVLQDTWLFNGTIKKNIAYGNLSATDEEICEAAKICHIDHVIRSLPKGYNMEISEDADNISQGEKQLLTIARAMLANPTFLILDEATSSVDTRTEILIQKAMDTLMKGRTSFIIAHRLSTIKNADLILVMNYGNIVEQGTHEELLAQKGFYANLYNSQFATGE
ncbi:MAG: ABC transporter ATP-binding protein [Patescibacteria group bacterium]|jgi:ATP-binding cassette subfamily B multidrug efflux pump